MNIDTIIFDLGGVLIDWNPRYVYRQIFDSEAEVDFFLENITSHDWNEEQDAGRPIVEATEMLVEKHPEYEQEIRAYYNRWEEMIGGALDETLRLLKQLHTQKGHKLLALTNWSAETFPKVESMYDFLQWFEGIVVSGIEKVRKPDARIYQLITDRYQLDPATSYFIDDNLRNIKAAQRFGFQVHHFQTADLLAIDLNAKGILDKIS